MNNIMNSITRRIFMNVSLKTGALLYIGSFDYSIYYEAELIETTKLDIKIKGLPEKFENFTITHISDLHFGKFVNSDFIKKSVETVNKLDSDIVVITGDFVEWMCYREKYVKLCMQEIASIRPREGVYAVLGNHDHKSDAKRITEELQRIGVCVLRNESTRLKRGNTAIQILGVDDMVEEKDNMEKTLSGVNESEVKILMSHSPDIAENYKLRGVDLILSGHTHGGQICLPFIGALITPSDYGRKFVSGLIKHNDIQIYVNRGIGVTIIPARFMCKPEITVFTLKSV